MDEKVLEVKNLAAAYRKNTVLHHVNFLVKAGIFNRNCRPKWGGKIYFD